MMKEKIGCFVFDSTKPTTMKYGYYYKAMLDAPFSKEQRTIRVWLPEDYDFHNPDKRYPVIYFSDGQNLVNKYLTAFGDWELDKVAHQLYEDNNISFIGVGIDSPQDDLMRTNELTPPYLSKKSKEISDPKADVFVDFICDTLKPLIDNLFYTKTDKENTAIGGSSMGGIMAFYGGVRRSDVFGFALDFSPAFLVYGNREWKEILESLDISPSNNVKHFFYVGGVDFEKNFISSTVMTYKYLLKKGFTTNNCALIIDTRMRHHEEAWHKYLKDAITFWFTK